MTPHAQALDLVERGRLRAAAHVLADADDPAARLTAAWIALDRGDTAAFARHLATTTFTGADRHRADCLRGLAQCRRGTPVPAIATLTRAIRGLRATGDDRWLANALVGRGIARTQALHLGRADADLTAAHAALTALGEPERAATCLHNRGFTALVAGDPAAALRHFEEATRAGLRTTRRPEALVDRAHALLRLDLVREARDVLHRAADLLDRGDRGAHLPDALLLAARCALRDRDRRTARALAERAESLFRDQHRSGHVPAARAVAIRAGRPGSRTATAAACARRGHHDDAAELRLPVAPRDVPRDTGTPRARAIGWLARARTAPTRRAAVAACRAGLRLHQPTTWPGTELAATALAHALTGGDARAAVRWAERRSHCPAPADTAAALAGLRRTTDHHRTTALEREVRRLSLAAGTTTPPPLDLADLTDALGDKAMLVFLRHRGRLLGVAVTAGRCALHDLGPAADAARHAKTLELKETRPALSYLDALLASAGDRPLVIVPGPELDQVPWAALPSLHGRPVTTAPSAGTWLAATRRRPSYREKLWIRGPGLRHADREINALHRVHGGQIAHTADAALAGMESADVVHIAAHGVRRTDVPLLSHLRLADGPLYGYDFDRLAKAPSLVVLSACDSGLANALVRRGARTVIASVRAVPDDRVVDLAIALHARPGPPARALAEAQARHGDLGFVCVGAG
ncbi:CHAT domain-containing protein [Saccharothrix obliqua]|uniref:CHAT domain-containing protein n=1 Tax=Saccharothrix obliqua TaxID=2861747 RepID=UPI001C5F577F|nr:CHAT domain-containing protein [Saccharothrix obliqua]MBW4715788.1 CHAT domain-containing protein [Saccharothrix obliqua]